MALLQEFSFPRSQRQAGTHTSPPVVLPAGAEEVTLTEDMDVVTLTDPQTRVAVRLYAKTPTGDRLIGAYTYVGGNYTDEYTGAANPKPVMTVGITAFAGMPTYMVLELARRTSVGAVLAIYGTP